MSLIAIARVSGAQQDRAPQTATPLENGQSGNVLGGLGSGLTYAGRDTFLSLPDRGPNAVVYNPTIDNTTSYIPRFHTLRMSLRKGAPSAALPYDLTFEVLHTTLLFDDSPLSYGAGDGQSLQSGAPGLNQNGRFYFSGRSDNFRADQPPSSNDARLDPESIRLSPDGTRVYVSDEYGPHVYAFDRKTGRRVASHALPPEYTIVHPRAAEVDEIAANKVGRVMNKGMEALAITPDGKRLIGMMQSPLLQDGGASGRFVRLVEIDLATSATSEYLYELSSIGTPEMPKYAAISDIVAVNDHEFLVDERDSTGLGVNNAAVFKRVYHIDLKDAPEVSGSWGEQSLVGKAVAKKLFIDVVATLNAHGIASTEIPSKLEALTFGQDVKIDGRVKHTLYLASDNDFLATLTDTTHPGGVENPTQFFVFAFDRATLPGYEPQRFGKGRHND